MIAQHFAQHLRRLAACLILFVAGCGGPTHTAGTSGVAAKDLSVLSIKQLPEEVRLQIHKIKFDDTEDEYEIGKSRDFYLLPGDHTASFSFVLKVPEVGGAADFFIPKKVTLPGPKQIPLGVLSAGKTYELAPPSDFDQIMATGRISLVREKGE